MKKWKKACIALAAALTVAGTAAYQAVLAYLTDIEHITNTFTMESLQILLKEPAWENLPDADGDKIPDLADPILSGTTVPKDPTITHVGGTDAFVYLEVVVPRAQVRLVSDDNITVSPSQVTDLYTFTVNSGWEMLSETVTDTSHTMLYAYTTGILKEGETTTALFDGVTYKNILEGTLEEGSQNQIRITAYAIQSKYLDDTAGTMKDKMAAAYQMYLSSLTH